MTNCWLFIYLCPRDADHHWNNIEFAIDYRSNIDRLFADRHKTKVNLLSVMLLKVNWMLECLPMGEIPYGEKILREKIPMGNIYVH